MISLLLLFLTFLMGAACSQLYVLLTHKPFPLQQSIPFIKNALNTNPVVAWVGVALVIPLVEETLFRGLFFGAFEKRWGVKGAILGSSLLFVFVHLQIVGFFYLFCLASILGWARWKSGSLGLPIVVHALNNLVALSVITKWTGTS
jgi:membrane protease YdiL (CAAX protease family)